MPFKSKAQLAKFGALVKEGKYRRKLLINGLQKRKTFQSYLRKLLRKQQVCYAAPAAQQSKEKRGLGFIGEALVLRPLFYKIMIICGVDVETTGLDAAKDSIIEMAWVIVDTERPEKPLELVSTYFSVKDTIISEEIVNLTGITNRLLSSVGRPPKLALDKFSCDLLTHKCDFIVAHNAPFDKLFIDTALMTNQLLPIEQEWIDTQRDIEYPKSMRSRELVSLCAYHGFLNPFPHSAVFDVMSMLKLVEHYNIEDILAYKAMPTVYLKALVSFDEKELAKARGFRWQEWEGRKFEKTWVKAVKQKFVEEEKALADFHIQEIS